MIDHTPPQSEIVNSPIDAKIFLEGPAGTGKTAVGVGRMLHLLEQGVPGKFIAVVVPQLTLALPYYRALRDPGTAPGGVAQVTTISGLARRMVELFFPLIAEEAGFAHPHQPPTFLNIETAQYYMARIVRPLLDEGYFETVTLDRNRLYSQILDNLNKAAFVRFPHIEFGERLGSAWIGEESQQRVYADAQDCANRFREYCLNHNLFDFSLLLEVFLNHLWHKPLCFNYLIGRYPFLIVDNIEEDTPAAHDVLAEWLERCQSALVISDWDAGYRRFLGADPLSARRLRGFCGTEVAFNDSYVTPPEMETFRGYLAYALGDVEEEPAPERDPAGVLVVDFHRYYPQMLDWVAGQIAYLVHEKGTPPGEIVVLAPFMSDALRFSLMNRLEREGVPVQSHRPSRSLREEPATQCLLTLAALAHPHWGLQPSRFEVAYALVQAIEGLDLVRAQLLSEILYRFREGQPVLFPFEGVETAMQERVTFLLGGRYDRLRGWLEDYQQDPPEIFDHFLSRLFGEVLAQPGYRFHQDLDAGKTASNLIDSVRSFRRIVGESLREAGDPLGREYIHMVQDGVIASQYIRNWDFQRADAVLVAPAYTFLMANRPVDYQFWLNVSSAGWWERLYQPLTHPYVLSRNWTPGEIWTDTHEVAANQDTLQRLTTGLLRRCRRAVYLGLTEFDEHGLEQRGPLLQAIQRVLRASASRI